MKGYEQISPEQLLSADLSAPEWTERPWTVRWDGSTEPPEEVVRRTLGDVVDFHTSGSTGDGRTWRRDREQLWAEAGLIGDMLTADRPEAVLSFAPPRHIYGMIATVLVPARLGLPVWYRPQFAPMPEDTPHRRWAVMAIPWTFRLLRQRLSWARGMRRLSIVHSTAMLPAAAGELLDELGDTASILELFGSTETGAVATRRSGEGDRHWRLCPDVELLRPRPGDEGEAPLVVRSPRLAHAPEGGAMTEWRMDDYVRALDERTIAMTNRRGRLVKINGRRFDLDLLEERVRSAVPCVDAACVPVSDPVIGEHFDVLLVPAPGDAPGDIDLAALRSALPCRPRRVMAADRIDRSETGKLRRLQTGDRSELGRNSAR